MPRQTRAERFRQIRDAVMPLSSAMTPSQFGGRELICGSFTILFNLLGGQGAGRGFNLQIWPGRRVDQAGIVLHDGKVANVDWNQKDQVDIFSYRSGAWERELLSILRSEGERRLRFRPALSLTFTYTGSRRGDIHGTVNLQRSRACLSQQHHRCK